MSRDRRALVSLSPQSVEALLVLPEGARVLAVHDAWPSLRGVQILIEADWLPETDERATPPLLHATLTQGSCGHLTITDWNEATEVQT